MSKTDTTADEDSGETASPFITIKWHESEFPVASLKGTFGYAPLFKHPTLIKRPDLLLVDRKTLSPSNPHASPMLRIASIEIDDLQVRIVIEDAQYFGRAATWLSQKIGHLLSGVAFKYEEREPVGPSRLSHPERNPERATLGGIGWLKASQHGMDVVGFSRIWHPETVMP